MVLHDVHSIIDDYNRVAVRFIDMVVESGRLITSAAQGIEILRKRIGRCRSKIAIILSDCQIEHA